MFSSPSMSYILLCKEWERQKSNKKLDAGEREREREIERAQLRLACFCTLGMLLWKSFISNYKLQLFWYFSLFHNAEVDVIMFCHDCDEIGGHCLQYSRWMLFISHLTHIMIGSESYYFLFVVQSLFPPVLE